MHTLRVFHTHDPDLGIVLVLPSHQVEYWQSLTELHGFSIPHRVAEGGDSRFASVRSGLSLIEGPGLVAVHDGVRPLVSHATIHRCFDAAKDHGAAIPVIPVSESIRKITGVQQSEMKNRELYRLVQTPQVFDLDLLRDAYTQEFDPAFTDDASVVEKLGKQVWLVEGNPENIKITLPHDLALAHHLIQTGAVKGERTVK
jgi:2-C-methyl-D-erythritol 4-phosphate cytidylyltransferase